MSDLATLRALAEAANRPEPEQYEPDCLTWTTAYFDWMNARRKFADGMTPAIVLALLAVAEAAKVWHAGKMGVRATTQAIFDAAELPRDFERNRQIDRAHNAAHAVWADAGDQLVAALDALAGDGDER